MIQLNEDDSLIMRVPGLELFHQQQSSSSLMPTIQAFREVVSKTKTLCACPHKQSLPRE